VGWGQAADHMDVLPWVGTVSAVAVVALVVAAVGLLALFEPWKWGAKKRQTERRSRRRIRRGGSQEGE
jgi:hypothetical protein